MALVDIYNNSSSIDRTAGIKEIINSIPELHNLTCVDFFAGNGSFCSHLLADNVKKITCIAYDQQSKVDIENNIPTADIIVGDALTVSKETPTLKSDIIFCDNPQGILPNGTSEYFEYLEFFEPLVKENGYLIHNINVLPYTYDVKSEWANRRNKFYNVDTAEKLTLEFMENFHKNYFHRVLGREVLDIKFIPREKYNSNIYLYFLMYQLA